LALERGAEWSVTTQAVPVMVDGTVRRTADMVTEFKSNQIYLPTQNMKEKNRQKNQK